MPIVADEARTFGMANLFKQVGIYSSVGQRYEPEDIGSVLCYREATDGQILEEGISEAGAIASWTAAATSYSVHGLPMLPFYIYYSMFGFQRVGDLIWAAADQRSRGFLLGATSGPHHAGRRRPAAPGRLAATWWRRPVPNCQAYDPAFAGEMAVILDHGMREMLVRAAGRVLLRHADERELRAADAAGGRRGRRDPRAVPASHVTAKARSRGAVRLLGSGAILSEVIAAAQLLADDWRHRGEVLSVTSWSELARDGASCERANRCIRREPRARSHVAAAAWPAPRR